MAEFDHFSAYWKSGPHRLRDEEELLQQPTFMPAEQGADTRHLKGAVYLAGYGVECVLKAFIISRQRGCQTLAQARDSIRRKGNEIQDICTARGHDLQYLFHLTGLGIHMDVSRRKQFGICSKWKTSWRYDPNIPPMQREEAEEFVSSAKSIMIWIRSQTT